MVDKNVIIFVSDDETFGNCPLSISIINLLLLILITSVNNITIFIVW